MRPTRSPHRPVRAQAAAAATLAALAALACRDEARDRAVERPPAPFVVAVDTVCWLGPAQVSAVGVGTVRLGTPAEELRRRCGARDTTLALGEGLLETGVVVDVGRATAVALTAEDGTVDRVVVPKHGPTTVGGVGVTNRVRAVRARHGRLCAFVEEGEIVVMAAALPGVSFVTDADVRRFARDTAALRDAELPPATRVTALLVHGRPAPCAAEP
jgi:hypothetical protein